MYYNWQNSIGILLYEGIVKGEHGGSMPLETGELVWCHPQAASAVQLPSNHGAHRCSTRVFSLRLGVNLQLEHYTSHPFTSQGRYRESWVRLLSFSALPVFLGLANYHQH